MKKLLVVVVSVVTTIVFTTSCTHKNGSGSNVIRNAVTDVDGNHYDAVRLGNQVWMQSNLRTTHFRDGSAIPQGTSDDYSYSQPYYNQPTTQEVPTYDVKTYGLYYNWPAVNDARGLCPKGWHVPTDVEWIVLEEYVGNRRKYVYGNDPDNIAKALASNMGWRSCNESGTPGRKPKKNNATGFTAVPAGLYNGYYGHYLCLGGGGGASFWSSTADNSYAAYCRTIYDCNASGDRCRYDKDNGLSVRCVKD